MSGFKKKSLLSCGLMGASITVILLLLCLMLGTIFLEREVVAEDDMNIIIILSVFISILVGGKTISGVRGRGYLLCYAICALSLIACSALVCALAGERGHFGLVLLEICASAWHICAISSIFTEKKEKEIIRFTICNQICRLT